MSDMSAANVRLAAAVAGGAVVASCMWLSWWLRHKRYTHTLEKELADLKESRLAASVVDLIGNTPMMYLRSLSEATGCEIYAKVEFLNPGGSGKDRIAKAIIEDAEKTGKLPKGGTIYEGTAGSTGISLSMVARAKGYECCIYLPDDIAKDKSDVLLRLGAQVKRVPPVGISDENHFVRAAEKAAEVNGGYFANQFENLANFKVHYETTGPEIYQQLNGKLDAFVMGSGTGGTIAGVSRYLKERNPQILVYLADPQGSSLHLRVSTGVCFTAEHKEGRRRKNQVDSIVEGIGINRLTANFLEATIDGSLRCTDLEAVEMSRYLMKQEGLFIGSSSSVNCVAAVKLARKLGPGHRIVTVLCDSGNRHLSKFWSDEFLAKEGLTPTNPNTLIFVQ